MGWMKSLGAAQNIMDPLGITGSRRAQNAADYKSAMAGAAASLSPKYAQANKDLTSGYEKAQETAKTGFDTARSDTTTGYGQARGELSSGYNKATNTARQGFDEAKAFYETPEMVGSRQELYNRVLGKGGMSDNTLELQKAKAREEYGTGMRSAQDSLKNQFGDSSSEGMAGENLARAAASLGAERANATREIDIGNEQLKRQEMTGAIGSLSDEANARAGLSADEAKYVSGLEARFADGSSSLTAQETNALSTLAASEGTTLADLQAKLASGQASLTSEEAKAIAEIMTATATGLATIQSGKSGMLF